jgi:hypothetical protein
MAPYDLKRDLKHLYAPKNTTWELVDVPTQQFIAVAGAGNPNTAPAYVRAVESLYAVAYALKFASKRDGRDFVVGPLEGLWWAATPAAFTARAKDSWEWRMMIAQPSWVTEAMVAAAVAAKGPAAPVRLTSLTEGRCAQVLHLGSYDAETAIMAELHDEYLPAQGLAPRDRHHEVYLSDPRRTEAEKLRTVIRQPVRSVS